MLVDTSVLIRTLQPHHSLYEVAKQAIRRLAAQRVELCVMQQNLVELWTVATRPLGDNGLGLTVAEAGVELDGIKEMFLLLPESPATYGIWEALVRKVGVLGKPSHDARLVASVQVHGITSILTFDRTGFSRFPEIEVIHPAEVVSSK